MTNPRTRCESPPSRLWLLPVLACSLPSAACVSLPSHHAADRPPVGVPLHVVTTWEPHVVTASDVVHDGAPLPGLAGRVYLFGASGCPITTEGSLKVELYNDAGAAPSGQPVRVGGWNFDAATLKQLLRKDIVGWGYTVFLPWDNFNPAITHVHFKVCFTPKHGTPLYEQGSPLVLQPGDWPRPIIKESVEVPGVPVVPPAPASPGPAAPTPAPERKPIPGPPIPFFPPARP